MSWDGTDRRKVIHNEHPSVGEALARIDERLKSFIDIFEKHTNAVEKKFEKHDGAISELQHNYWKAIGALAALIFAVEIGIKLLVPKKENILEKRIEAIEKLQSFKVTDTIDY